jgi:hypothetical protein
MLTACRQRRQDHECRLLHRPPRHAEQHMQLNYLMSSQRL